MSNIKKMYEGYWKTKETEENFQDYERNEVLKKLFKKNEQVLDLASGHGAVSEFIKSLGCQVTALDISEEALKIATSKGLKTILADVEKKLPFKDKTFNTVFWGDNAEHLFLPMKTLKEINRILKPGGRIIISCPNMGYWRYRLYYLLEGMIPQTEWCSQNPWEWQHIRFFNKAVIKKFLEEADFKLCNFFGISRRKLDQPLKWLFPSIFGMIMVIEASKN